MVISEKDFYQLRHDSKGRFKEDKFYQGKEGMMAKKKKKVKKKAKKKNKKKTKR